MNMTSENSYDHIYNIYNYIYLLNIRLYDYMNMTLMMGEYDGMITAVPKCNYRYS